MRKSILLTPGPTQVPEEVLVAGAMPIIHHRTPQFEAIFAEATKGLQYIYQTKNPVMIFASSGTGALESSVVNLLSAGDKVIVVVGGKFGERWANLTKAYGLNTIQLTVPWNETVDPKLIEKTLQENPDVKAVYTTLSETSTGGVTDIEAIAKIVKKTEAVLVVDAVSGLGVVDIKTDEWSVDVVVAGSQKGLMLPPGLAFASVSEKAIKMMETSKLPKFYFSWKKALKEAEKNTSPWTPGISLIVQLNEAIKIIKEEGLENVFARHTRLSDAVKAGMAALGMTIFNKNTGSACCAVLCPEGIDGDKLVKMCRDKFKVTLTGGQDEIKGKVFRIAMMGNVNDNDAILGVSAVERGLIELGYKFEPGKGVAATMKALLAK
jgi:aspartate aminotransferase-like enzyme